jgi:hypothetical protein
MRVRFVGDVKKGAANLRKHGVSFEEASSVFFDPLSATGMIRMIRLRRVVQRPLECRPLDGCLLSRMPNRTTAFES